MKNVKNAERKLSVNGKNGESTLNLNFIEDNDISRIYVLDGEEYNREKSGIWLDNYYAIANEIKVGDWIELEYDGYKFKEEVKGLINVPDHLYNLKDESQLVPNFKEYGFAYLSSKELKGCILNKIKIEQNLTDELIEKMNINYEDYVVFNYLMIDVDEKENVQKVKTDVEENIENIIAVIKAEDTTSYSSYQGEIDEGKTYVGVFSGLFIFIALLSVITTMTRIVNKQKLQIGTLKALGFKNRKIIKHYINYGLYIAIIGSILGLVLGYYGIGKFFMGMEMEFFEIPNGVPKMDNSSYIIALIAVLCVTIATYLTVRKHLRKTAADSLRNEIPNVKTKNLNITTKGIFKHFKFSTKWNIRDMFRNKIRTITGIVGIASCTLLLVCAFGMLDSMKHFVKMQFSDLYNFDYKLSINENINEKDKKELENKYGTSTSQSVLIEIKDGDELKSNNLFVYDGSLENNTKTGVDKNNETEKVRFLDNKEKFVNLNNDEGVYITYKLAKTMNKKVGDYIEWRIQGSNDYYKSKIVGLNKDPQNQNMTATRKYFESLGFEYKYDSLYTDKKINKDEKIIGVDVISDIDSLEEGMNSMLSRMKSMVYLIAVIAVILGFIIIYNTSILSYTEKQYQFATLKVLGFKDKKIKKIFTQQNNIITLISVIIGLPSGYYLTDWIFKTAIEESYDFGAYINLKTYVIATLGTIVVSLAVSKFISKKIKTIDMVSSLKANE